MDHDDSWQLHKFGYLTQIQFWVQMMHLVPYDHDLRYGTMCNLRYFNKVADKAAVCHLILSPSWGLLMQHSLKRKSSLR